MTKDDCLASSHILLWLLAIQHVQLQSTLQGIFLESKLCSSPVSSLGVVSDFVSGLHPHPLWHWSVLVHRVRKFALDDECLVRRHPVFSWVDERPLNISDYM